MNIQKLDYFLVHARLRGLPVRARMLHQSRLKLLFQMPVVTVHKTKFVHHPIFEPEPRFHWLWNVWFHYPLNRLPFYSNPGMPWRGLLIARLSYRYPAQGVILPLPALPKPSDYLPLNSHASSKKREAPQRIAMLLQCLLPAPTLARRGDCRILYLVLPTISSIQNLPGLVLQFQQVLKNNEDVYFVLLPLHPIQVIYRGRIAGWFQAGDSESHRLVPPQRVIY